ncbi:UNVERIFIED_CONTAM: hypothetical protein RMT77_001384 [Armadillidium vulgare]
MEIIKLGKEMGLKGKELLDFFKESQTRAAAEAEKARAKAAKQRELEYRLLKIRLGLVSEFDDSIEELHNESSKSADRVKKLEEENELKIELADPKQEKAVLPSISGSELSRQITSSRESPTKGENVFSQRKVSDEKETSPSQGLLFQPETFAERETTLSRDMSIPSALSKQEENEDEIFSSSTEIEYGGTPILNCEKIYMRENEERVCFVKKTISFRKELRVELPRVALTDNMEKIDTFLSSELDLEDAPVEGEKNKVAEKRCWKPHVQVKLEEGELSDNSVTSSDNSKQMKEIVVIKSEVEDSSHDSASIIERRKSGSIQLKNPTRALNGFYLGLEYMVISQSGLPNDSTFIVRLELKGLYFEVSGRSKKREKYMTVESTSRDLVQFRNENEVVQILESNCPKRVKFAEDSPACKISSSLEFKESVQGVSFNKRSKDCSGTREEQKTAPSQITKNAIVLFNDLRKRVKYKMLEESDNSHTKTFKFNNNDGAQCFEGTGSKKISSKAVATKEAMSKLFDFVIPSSRDLYPNLHRPENLADRIAKSVCEKLFSLTSEKSTLARRKIQQTRLYKYRRKGKIIIK